MVDDPELPTFFLLDSGGKLPSRRYTQATAAERSRYARQLGEVAFAWNSAHAKLYRLFGVLIADYDWPLADALWHSFQSDSAQRSMFEAALTNRGSEITISNEKAIFWSISILNQLAAHRNEIVHTDVLFLGADAVPGEGVRPSHSERMEALPLKKKWQALCGDLHAIANYLEGVFFALIFGKTRPLWRKPRLRFSHSKTASSQERRRQAKKVARERQRQSSQ